MIALLLVALVLLLWPTLPPREPFWERWTIPYTLVIIVLWAAAATALKHAGWL